MARTSFPKLLDFFLGRFSFFLAEEKDHIKGFYNISAYAEGLTISKHFGDIIKIVEIFGYNFSCKECWQVVLTRNFSIYSSVHNYEEGVKLEKTPGNVTHFNHKGCKFQEVQ